MQMRFFVFAWPGYLEAARRLEQRLVDRGRHVSVIASGLDNAPDHWSKLSNDSYFGDQFALCLRMFVGDVLVHIQADATIDDLDEFLRRLEHAHSEYSPGVWAPDVDYTFYATRLVTLDRELGFDGSFEHDSDLVQVLNTDCTCWSISAIVVEDLLRFTRSDWRYGWGWDHLAAAISLSRGLPVVRDLSIRVLHRRGTGYSAMQAAVEFERVKSDLPPTLKSIVALQEAVIAARYAGSIQWAIDRLRHRLPSRLVP